MSRERIRTVLQAVWFGLLVLAGGAAVYWMWHIYGERLPSKLGSLAIVVAPLPVVLVLTRLFPAKPDQRLFSAGLLQDAIYFVQDQGLRLTFVAFYLGIMRDVYDQHLSFLTIAPIAAMPMWGRLTFSVLAADFLGWFHHFVRHKVPWFWNFHTIHHSQRDMNYFTSTRVHAVDEFIAHSIIFIPTYMFQVSVPASFWYGIAVGWHTLIYHSNLKLNYGPLRYVLVTPQSHRVHHSSLREHHDRNFGVVFSIWDRLFGTSHPDDQSYPETGIREAGFPMERQAASVALLGPYFAQLIYPFRAILRRR